MTMIALCKGCCFFFRYCTFFFIYFLFWPYRFLARSFSSLSLLLQMYIAGWVCDSGLFVHLRVLFFKPARFFSLLLCFFFVGRLHGCSGFLRIRMHIVYPDPDRPTERRYSFAIKHFFIFISIFFFFKYHSFRRHAGSFLSLSRIYSFIRIHNSINFSFFRGV